MAAPWRPDDDERPKPNLNGLAQPGITDPQWPLKRSKKVPLSDAVYAMQYAGRVDRQNYLALVVADLQNVEDRSTLRNVLRTLSLFVQLEMRKTPRRAHLPPLALLPESWRLTITVGFGWKLFRDEHGDDRFGIDSSRPRHLKPMPSFPKDVSGFCPETAAGDFLFVISSDHPYVNVAIARSIAQGYALRGLPSIGPNAAALRVKSIEQGFGRPDKREFLRFDDGIDNLSNHPDGDLDRLVYVHRGDDEPDWCIKGSYLVYRKIQENLTLWEHLAKDPKTRDIAQGKMVGRHKYSSQPLSRHFADREKMIPLYPDPTSTRDGPLDAHIRKVQPRRPDPDIFGGNDLDRRFLRRPYPFFSGLNGAGEVECGLHFLAFQRNLSHQFEWVTKMWQMNPDFPVQGTGIDALFARDILSTLTGGYYFCPAAPRGPNDFLAAR